MPETAGQQDRNLPPPIQGLIDSVERLSELRRQPYREATDRLDRQVLRGTRWLLLKHPDHLDDQRDERRWLEEALELNRALAMVH